MKTMSMFHFPSLLLVEFPGAKFEANPELKSEIDLALVFSRTASRGDTPLHDAARQGQAAVAQLRLAANAPLDARNNDGRGPRWDDGLSGSFAWGCFWGPSGYMLNTG